MLKGTMEVLEAQKIKKEIWKDEYEMYYKGGRDGGDFIILKFTAESGRYYGNFKSENFEVG
jgi:general stress protein 26